MHLLNALPSHAGRNVVIPCHSKDLAKAIEAVVQATFGDKKVGQCYTADISDETKDRDFALPEEHWHRLNYLIYTLMLEVGVSYEVRGHFNVVIAFFSNFTTPLWNTSQMLFRVQDVKRYFVFVHNLATCVLNPSREGIQQAVLNRRLAAENRQPINRFNVPEVCPLQLGR